MRRLLAATIPEGFTHLETLTLSATSSSFRSFTTPGIVGENYFIVASGTAKIGRRVDNRGDRFTDAVKFDDLNETRVFSRFTVTSDGGRFRFEGLTDADGDGLSWGPFQPDHVYGQLLKATSSTLRVQFSDNPYSDNAGSMTLKLYAQAVDLDVDSDNTGTIDHSNIEEEVEDDAARGGKVIQTNAHDMDEDGIPDFADGYRTHGSRRAAIVTNGVKFVPCTIRVAEPLDPRQARFRFDYAASDPAQVQRTGDGTLESPYIFTAADGHLRLWTRDNDQIRNATPANQAGGNYIAPGADFVYSGEQLGFVGNSRTTTLWIEAVRHHQAVGDGRIVVHLDPDGPGPMGFTSEDAVRVTAVAARLAVDANGDGTINTDNRDFTTAERPFRFWLNDNSDAYRSSAVDLGGGAVSMGGQTPDSQNAHIGSDIWDDGDPIVGGIKRTTDPHMLSEIFRRDLEDFAAVGLNYSTSLSQLATTVAIELKGAASGGASLRLWRASSSVGVGFEDNSDFRAVESAYHVTSPALADAIMGVTNNATHAAPDSYVLLSGEVAHIPMAEFEPRFGLATRPGGVTFARLLFEGVTPGAAEVTISIRLGETVLASSSFDLSLHPVTDLYEHHTVAYGGGVAANGTWSNSNTAVDPRLTPVKTVPRLVSGEQAASYARDNDYTLYVHGWNMDSGARIRFADTGYKRLYWQGYRGTYGMFSWPTQIGDPLADPGNFNRSEEIAWNSAAGLRSLLANKQAIRPEGKLTILGHSMGGIVVSEALALAGHNNVADTVILTQAAVTTELYATTVAPTPYYPAFAGQVGGVAPRFSNLNQATTKLVNFHNIADYALALWLANNESRPGGALHPPSWTPLAQVGFLGATYEVAVGPPVAATRNIGGLPPMVLRMGFDTYELFAHALYTNSRPIGSNDAIVAPFTGYLDLRSLGFTNSRTDHSGQFNHTNIRMKTYWARLMAEAGLAQ